MKTDDLIKIFGTPSKVARFLGITPQAVYQWPEYVPRHWGYEIEARSNGLIKYQPEPGSEAEKVAATNFCTFKQKYIKTKG